MVVGGFEVLEWELGVEWHVVVAVEVLCVDDVSVDEVSSGVVELVAGLAEDAVDASIYDIETIGPRPWTSTPASGGARCTEPLNMCQMIADDSLHKSSKILSVSLVSTFVRLVNAENLFPKSLIELPSSHPLFFAKINLSWSPCPTRTSNRGRST